VDAYIQVFVGMVTPSYVITFVDNNPRFYRIKLSTSEFKTVFFQNGQRFITGDPFAKIEKVDGQKVDFMFVFGNCIGQRYGGMITGKVIPLGSIRNNMIPKTICVEGKLGNTNKTLLFVSQWRHRSQSRSLTKTYKASYQQIYLAEKYVISALVDWCKSFDYKLNIAGASIRHSKFESEFYNDLISDFDYEFSVKTNEFGSYRLIDRSSIVVSIDSTLGLESLGRGRKTAFFSIRGRLLNVPDRIFGWPGRYPTTGPFWTNEPSAITMKSILLDLSLMSDAKWESLIQPYQQDLMRYDEGNRIVIETLNLDRDFL
jgi:surface carbohydrate biosynthesis protein